MIGLVIVLLGYREEEKRNVYPPALTDMDKPLFKDSGRRLS